MGGPGLVRGGHRTRGLALIELLVLMAIVACSIAAAAVGFSWGRSHSRIVGVLLALAGLFAVPLALMILSAIGSGLSWIRSGPQVPTQRCARGCPARGFSPQSRDGTSVWCCPCGLSYVLRAPSFGTHEMRYWHAGHEKPFLRRRIWWRWRTIEAQRGGPYR